MESSDIIAALPGDLNDRITLAHISHREGYPPDGVVSADGKMAALLVVPPDASERSARSNGNEIWLLGIDGTAPSLLNVQMGFLADWSPDGKELTAGRYIPVENGTDTLTPDRVELVELTIDSGAEKVIRSEDGQAALRGLGWSADSSRYLAAFASGDGWSIEAWSRESGSWDQVLALPVGKNYTSISLAPDGQKLLLVEEADGKATVSLKPLDGTSEMILTEAPRTAGSRPGIFALWNQKGSDLLLFAEKAGQRQVIRPLAAETNAPASPEPLSAAAAANPGLVPLGWSPDAAWLVYRDYTDPALPLMLQDMTASTLRRIESLTSGGSLTFIGWMIL